MSNILGTSLMANLGRLLSDFLEKIAGHEGQQWPEEFKEVTWTPEPLWKKVSETAINVNLGFSPKLPFDGAQIEKHIGSGWAVVEKREDGLYVDSRKVILHLSKRQQGNKRIKGYELRDELTGKQPVPNANILDALCENPYLIPEDWKRDENGNTRYILFWGTIFRRVGGGLYVCSLYFSDGGWIRNYYWLGGDWDFLDPAALLAN